MDDINAAFDDIVFAEDQLNQQAYQEGFHKGSSEDNIEGYHLGFHRGAEIGSELGYYYSIVSFYLQQYNEETDKKIYGSLSNVKKLIENFPKINDESDYLSKLEVIRGQYRKSCSLLKINGQFPESNKMSF